jgi:heptaprenyl diphosphate synthase
MYERSSPARRAAFYGVFLTLGVLAGYVERTLPSPIPALPGVKLGLANIIPLFLMYVRSDRAAFILNILRCLLSGLLFTGVSGTLYALAGASLAFAAMALAKRVRIFGLIGVSAAGGVFHNVGQLLVAALVVGQPLLFYYLPELVVFGVAAGSFTGYIAGLVIRRIGGVAGQR